VRLRTLSRFSTCLFASALLLGTFAGICIAPETPAEPPARARGPLAEQYVHQKLALWQKRLKLQDWTITVIMSRPGDLRRGTLGNIRWDADKKTARIRVLDTSAYHRPFLATLNDMEFTVVHELIHLELSPVTRSEQSRSAESFSAEEDAVNRTADALLHLDRKD
jgi:hypothetical protein